MRTSEFIELTDPTFEGFVIGSVEISPGVFRIRRIPKSFLVVTGPPGPQGPQGTGVGDMLKSTYDPTNVDERLIGETEYNSDQAAQDAAIATKADDAATTAALAGKQPLDPTLTSLAAYNTNGILTQTAADTFVGRIIAGTVGQVEVTDGDGVSGNPTVKLHDNVRKVQFGITIDGGAVAITTGLKGYLRVPIDMTITGWEITADQSGSVVIDVWKDTYANYPPTVADTIFSTKPTLSAVIKNQNLAPTFVGAGATVTNGDYVAFNVDSATTVQIVQLSIFGTLL